MTPYYNKGAKSESAAYKMWAAEFIESIGGKVTREGLGDVIFSGHSIKVGFSYIKNGIQKAAFAAVPEVIRHGEEINSHNNHKGGQADSKTFAAAIEMDGEPFVETVVVRYSQNEHRYKAHKLFLPDGSVIELDNEKAEAANTATKSPLRTSPASDDIVSNQEKNSNNKMSLKEREQIYESLNIDPLVYFKGTMEQIDAAEKSREARKKEFKDLIERNQFMALQFTHPTGAMEILHHSTRPGIEWQLSYYGNDGIANMHENYGLTGEARIDDSNVHTMDELYYKSYWQHKDPSLS